MVKTKAELLVEIEEKGIDLPEGSLTNADLQALLDKNEEKITPEPPAETPALSVETPEDNERITPTPAEDAPPELPKAKGDYLQRFQYGKDLPLGDPRTDPAEGSKAARQKAYFLKQRTILVMIPRVEGQDNKILFSVNINGYRLDFPKNTQFELPEDVARMIMDSQHQQSEALQYMRTDRLKDGVIVADQL